MGGMNWRRKKNPLQMVVFSKLCHDRGRGVSTNRALIEKCWFATD